MGAPPQISSTTFASLSLSQVNLRRAARRRLVARGAGARRRLVAQARALPGKAHA